MDASFNVPALFLDGKVIWVQRGDLSNDGGRTAVKMDNTDHNTVGYMMEPFLGLPHEELIEKTQLRIAERVASEADGYYAAVERQAAPGRIAGKLRELKEITSAAEFFNENKDRFAVGEAEAWFYDEE